MDHPKLSTPPNVTHSQGIYKRLPCTFTVTANIKLMLRFRFCDCRMILGGATNDCWALQIRRWQLFLFLACEKCTLRVLFVQGYQLIDYYLRLLVHCIARSVCQVLIYSCQPFFSHVCNDCSDCLWEMHLYSSMAQKGQHWSDVCYYRLLVQWLVTFWGLLLLERSASPYTAIEVDFCGYIPTTN